MAFRLASMRRLRCVKLLVDIKGTACGWGLEDGEQPGKSNLILTAEFPPSSPHCPHTLIDCRAQHTEHTHTHIIFTTGESHKHILVSSSQLSQLIALVILGWCNFLRVTIMPTFEFKVEMTCTGCSGALERVLGKAKEKGEINSFSVDLNTKTVIVETSKNRAEAEEIVKKAGKDTVFVEERA